MEKVVVVQAEATSTGANTVGIVEIRASEVNRSCLIHSCYRLRCCCRLCLALSLRLRLHLSVSYALK